MNVAEVVDLLSGNDPMDQKIFEWDKDKKSFKELQNSLVSLNDDIVKSFGNKYRVIFKRRQERTTRIVAYIQKKGKFLWKYQLWDIHSNFVFILPVRSIFGKLNAEKLDSSKSVLDFKKRLCLDGDILMMIMIITFKFL